MVNRLWALLTARTHNVQSNMIKPRPESPVENPRTKPIRSEGVWFKEVNWPFRRFPERSQPRDSSVPGVSDFALCRVRCADRLRSRGRSNGGPHSGPYETFKGANTRLQRFPERSQSSWKPFLPKDLTRSETVSPNEAKALANDVPERSQRPSTWFPRRKRIRRSNDAARCRLEARPPSDETKPTPGRTPT